MKPLAVVGLDPGTTVGFALMALDGRIIESGSSRLMDFNSLLKHITGLCLPVIVATDKREIPGAVRKLATKVGAKLWLPEEDLMINDKKSIAEAYAFSDDHEMDSISCARLALNHYLPIIQKIERFASNSGRLSIAESLKRLVIVHSMSIKTACELLEEPDSEQSRLVKDAIRKREFGREYELLLQKIREHREVIDKQHEELESLSEKLEKQDSMLRTIRNRQPIASEIIQNKERSLRSLTAKLGSVEAELRRARIVIESLNRFISKSPDRLIMKKLENLTASEIHHKTRLLNIMAGDVIFVSDATNVSYSAAKGMKIRMAVSKIGTTAQLPFPLLKVTEMPIEETDHFILFDKSQLDRAKSDKEVIGRVVDEYRRTRST